MGKKEYGYIFVQVTGQKAESGGKRISMKTLAIVFKDELILKDGKVDQNGLRVIVDAAKKVCPELPKTQEVFVIVGTSKKRKDGYPLVTSKDVIVFVDYMAKFVPISMKEAFEQEESVFPVNPQKRDADKIIKV